MSASTEPLATVDQLIKIAQHPKMVGIGETGLDYHYTAESADIQKTSLKIHIEAARETNLPLIIHSRAADEDMATILKDEFNNGHYKCVMHCFSSSVELAKLSLELIFESLGSTPKANPFFCAKTYNFSTDSGLID